MDSAFQIEIVDKDVQAYLQKYPFGVGSRSDLNRKALLDLRRGLHVRPKAEETQFLDADPTALCLSAEEISSIGNWFERLQVEDSQQTWAWRSLAWKLMRIPRNTASVLSIGCGGGIELVVMRALLPEADLVAVDFDDKVPTRVKDALGLHFFQEHFNTFLSRSERLFDLVFCNHVLEHLYEPEVTLQLIRRSLRPNASLIAGLPMEGCSDGVFAASMRRIVSKASALHILDVGVLDAGHAWKTNPADLRSTLERQGFEQIELHVCKARASLRSAVARKLGVLLYACSFGLARRAAKLFASESAPPTFVRLFLAAERRCWFGANRLKNRFAKEVLVQARSNDCGQGPTSVIKS